MIKKMIKKIRNKWHNDLNSRINDLHINILNYDHGRYFNIEKTNFIISLIKEILLNVNNQYDDNYDYYRFGENPPTTINSNQYYDCFNTLIPYLN
jgi:hypothetical protein